MIVELDMPASIHRCIFLKKIQQSSLKLKLHGFMLMNYPDRHYIIWPREKIPVYGKYETKVCNFTKKNEVLNIFVVY